VALLKAIFCSIFARLRPLVNWYLKEQHKQQQQKRERERVRERERDTALIFSPYHFYLDFVREVKICMQCLLIVKEIVSHDDITKSWNQILSIAEFC